MERANRLCVRKDEGTLDLWVNYEPRWTFGGEDTKWELIATFNGETPENSEAYRFTFDKDPVKAIDEFMGVLGRDVENWHNMDIVIHWGVHTWKFINNHNVTDVEKDEYAKSLEDIKFYYDVEW